MKKEYMKFIILFLITFPVFACQINIPTSEAQRYIDAMPSGVPPLWSCADKPDEACMCADKVFDWNIVEIADEVVPMPYNEVFSYETKKVLRVSEAKKSAYEASIKAEKEAKLSKLEKLKAAKVRLMSFEPKGKTIAELKAELKQFADDVKEVLE